MSFEILKKILKILLVVIIPPMVFILIPIKKIESVTEFTVFTFWQVLNETYSSFNSNYALKLIRAPEFGIAKY